MTSLMERYPSIDRDRHLEHYRITQDYATTGDQREFNPLFCEEKLKMEQFVRYKWKLFYLLNEQDIEDVIGEAVCASLTSIGQFGGWSLLSTWMKKIAWYRLIDMSAKKHKENRNRSIDSDLPPTTLADETIMSFEGGLIIDEVLNSFSEDDNGIVIKKVTEGKEFAEIAKELNVSEYFVAKRYGEIRKELKCQLQV